MKKIVILFLVLFTMVAVAYAGTTVAKPAKLKFNDCPKGLKVVTYGLNYVISGNNRGKARVFVKVRALDSVLLGCAYLKVYTKDGKVIYKGKKRIKLFMGSEDTYGEYIPASRIKGRDIKAEIGVGCGCGRGGY